MIVDFPIDHPIIFWGSIFLLFLGVGVWAMQKDAEFQSAHVCVQKHKQYNPPVYVKSGNVMVPVGGGMITVCDEWLSK